MHLFGALEVSLGKVEVLTHHAEVDAFCTEYVADLAQHFVDPHVRSHVAGAVVSGEEQLQLLSRLPRCSSAQHPTGFGALDVTAYPGLQNEIHHAAVPPRAAGQGSYLYSN